MNQVVVIVTILVLDEPIPHLVISNGWGDILEKLNILRVPEKVVGVDPLNSAKLLSLSNTTFLVAFEGSIRHG